MVFLNPVAESLTGWKQNEAEGLPLESVFPISSELTGEPIEHPVAKVIREGVVVGLGNHTLLLRRDGTAQPIADSAAPITDAAGNALGVVLVFRDVTEQRQSLRALRESEARKTAILDTALDCIITMDHEGKVIEFNPAAEKTFGYHRADAVGKPLAELIIPQSLREQHYRGIAHYLATGEGPVLNKRIEMPALRADGLEFPVELSTIRIPTEGPPVFTAYLRDISERNWLEQGLRKRVEELAAAEERVQSIVNHVVDGIISIDEGGTITTFNPAAERLFGYTSSEVIGQNVKMLMPDPFHSEHDEYLAHYLRTGEAKIIGIGREVAGRRQDGSTFPMDLAVSEFSLGRRRFFTGIVRDITERKQLEQGLRQRVEELAEADRRKSEFLAILSHELRNPLAPIRTAVEILRTRGPTDADLQWPTDVIDRQVQHLGRLVHDLLDLSRISRGKIDLYRECLPISAVVSGALETSRPNIEANGHELTVSEPLDPLFVDGDLTRLAQAVANLLNNAAKYTPRGGHIWLSAEPQAGAVVLRVRDNGNGIPAEMISSIFDMFTQVDTSLERKTGGLGIGLTLARQLVDLHGGSIEAHSPGLGQGSEFIVRLPQAPPELMRPRDHYPGQQKPASQIASPARRILVVDDNKDAADSFAKLMELNGHEVRKAHDGLEAIDVAASFRPDVVLLDIGLPKLNGYEAARRIRGEPWGKNMMLVAVTGWGQEEDRQRSQEAGFDHHLVKPVKAAAINELLVKVSSDLADT